MRQLHGVLHLPESGHHFDWVRLAGLLLDLGVLDGMVSCVSRLLKGGNLR